MEPVAVQKYIRVARTVEQLIQRQKLKPGDALPSERELAKQLGVAYGTVRMANDYLYRNGVIDRHQGRGTFIAERTTDAAAVDAQPSKSRRLGLVAIESVGSDSSILRAVTFALQRQVCEMGYELIVEQWGMDDLIAGKLPRMVRRGSVCGFFIYGRVGAHHVRFLQEQSLPYLLIGNRPVPADTPQVRIDAEGLGYQLTAQLLKAGRSPVWFDADPANTDYVTGQDMLRGHQRAVFEHGDGSGSLHLCSLRMSQIDRVAQQLLRSNLENAAYIVEDWAVSMLMTTMAMRDVDKVRQLLIVPAPFTEICKQLWPGPNVMRWTRTHSTDALVEPAVNAMTALLEGATDKLESVEVTYRCGPVVVRDGFEMSLDMQTQPYVPAATERGDNVRI